MSNSRKIRHGRPLLFRTVLLALLSVYSTLCYSEYLIQVESHLKLVEPKIVNHVNGVRYQCRDMVFQLVTTRNDVSYFSSYLNLYKNNMPLINQYNYRSELYERSYDVLIDEILRVPGVRLVDNGKALAVPDQMRKVYSYWVSVLAAFKRSSERSMCRDMAVAKELGDSDAVLNRFVNSYNNALQSYNEISKKCKRPEDPEWTRSKEGMQYISCQKKTSQERMQKDQLLRSYRSIFNFYKDIFDKEGLTPQILDDEKWH